MNKAPLSPSLAQIQEPIEDELRAVLQSHSEPLYRIMEYQMGWVDEQGVARPPPTGPRVHASWCLITCKILGGDFSQGLAAAAALEFVYQYSLIHDDIQNGNPERNHRPAVWWHWGPGQAINAGDGLHALARLALFRLSDAGVSPYKVLEATRVLDQACLDLCEGQYLELLFQERIDITQEAYVRMAKARTGALLGGASELGALLANVPDGIQAAVAAAGRKLGLAFQVHQELASLWGSTAESHTPGNILNKQKTLPLVYALEQADVRTKRELGTLYLKRVLDPADIPRLISLLDQVGARDFCNQVAEGTIEEAMEVLREQGLSPAACEELREAWTALMGSTTV